jgi:hypothetical protein
MISDEIYLKRYIVYITCLFGRRRIKYLADYYGTVCGNCRRIVETKTNWF